jgi:hypothetical protein
MGSMDSLRTPFKETCENMTKSEIGYVQSSYVLSYWLCFLLSDVLFASCRSFLKALTFCQSNQYINTARIDPALLYVENSRLRIKDKKCLAVCIMSGTLTESYLVASSEAGPRHSPYPIHKVTIAPLEQEMRRDASVWGNLFDFRVITGMMSPAGFAFATRGEGKGDGWSNGKWSNISRIVLIVSHSVCPVVTCQVKDFGLEVCFLIAIILDSRFFLFSFPFLQRPW